MLIIPAVDIKGGRCVRLLQGRKDSETVFSDDPSSMASRWEAEGAELLHVVDLDGAFEKAPQNIEAIKGIVNAVRIPMQLGGGIRTMDTISMYLDLGIARVIVGTEAIRHPGLVKEASEKYPGRIVVGIDARDGLVAVEGWTETTRQGAVDVAKGFESLGLAAIVFTDIHRDGMQTGPSVGQTKRLAESVNIPIIASGGVSNIDDIEALLPLEEVGVEGVITGRALYAGTLDLRKALEMGRRR
ncbi:MAG: 1-(5-phosphoribosyl)-5-[(5-phosphoribosylamino)methylideneamino]imidazole-4-carboxamide isomerase [Thermodesulfobacteriota bacterium]|nr:1-(5-phosphoribosyl)-5-[(5-phosphoribosylamino)methylideneamino]imidazole-4-carboxamide isomerase [Thermodesulfobacteriota bacterium]